MQVYADARSHYYFCDVLSKSIIRHSNAINCSLLGMKIDQTTCEGLWLDMFKNKARLKFVKKLIYILID